MPAKGIILALGLAAVAGSPPSAPLPPVPERMKPVWSEVSWPFLMDQWGRGRAFRCRAGDCGVEVSLYVRPKVGFCDCGRGVYDDAELDRIADVDLFSSKWAPTEAGRAVAVGWMKGRARPYHVDASVAQPHVLAIGLNSECDAVVATVASSRALPYDTQRAALDFLNRDIVLHWAKAQLGLR